MNVLINLWEQRQISFQEKIFHLNRTFDKQTFRMHVDVEEDGFADVTTIMPEEWIDFPHLAQVDVHLMVNDPLGWVKRICVPHVTRAIGQIERINDVRQWVSLCNQNGILPGICVDYPTTLKSVKFKLKDFVHCCDSFKIHDPQILVMGYNAGYEKQNFHEDVVGKIIALREMFGKNAEIIVDGGINADYAQLCCDAGSDGVAVYSFIWNHFPENYYRLTQIC